MQNYRCKTGEIDIVASKDNILRFIEVKYRSSNDFGYSAETVNARKQKKIIKAAQWFMVEHNINENVQCSFDIIAIDGKNIEYIYNAYGSM